MNRKAMVGMALAVALVIPMAAGCAGKGKMSASRLCAGAGGKYSMSTQTCDAPAMNSRKGSDICARPMADAGNPLPRTCEVGLD